MTRGPLVISKASAAFGRDSQMYDSSFGWRFVNPRMEELYGTDAMGETAENLAERVPHQPRRPGPFAYESQQSAAAARDSGRFAREIVPVPIPAAQGRAAAFRARRIHQSQYLAGRLGQAASRLPQNAAP